MKYTLYIRDNFLYQDPWEDGSDEAAGGDFCSLEEAIIRAKHVVDDYLMTGTKGMTAEELYDSYITFGKDPYIVGGPPHSTFSAWDYAKKRCGEICSGDES